MAGTSKNTITAAFGGNVGGRLFFAGEHTSAAYRGTVHGAFQSGQVRISPHLPSSPTPLPHTYLPFTSPAPPFVPAQVAARAVQACSAGSCPAGSTGQMSASLGSSDNDPCFPSEALIPMADGTPRRLDALRAGDSIVAARADGTLTTDTVSTLSLADADVQGTAFVVLTTASGRNLTLTPTHHVPVGAACCATLKQAKDVAVGETVYEAVSASAAVRATQVKKIGTATKPGLHSPVLSHGTMPIVNGVATSFDALHRVRLAAYGLPCMQVLTTAPFPSGAPRLLRAAATRGDRAHRHLPRRCSRRRPQVHCLNRERDHRASPRQLGGKQVAR